MLNEVHDELFKVILAGDASVGKTNLTTRFIKGAEQHSQNISPTIGVHFATKTVRLQDGKKIKTQIWDTAGQEQYRAITTAHYRKALGALVVYDITKQKSFHNVKRWIDSIREQAEVNVVIVVVGNKIDLRDRQLVTTAEGKKFARNQGVLFEETSALTNENVENTFMLMLEEINKRKKEKGVHVENEGFTLREGRTKSENCEC